MLKSLFSLSWSSTRDCFPRYADIQKALRRNEICRTIVGQFLRLPKHAERQPKTHSERLEDKLLSWQKLEQIRKTKRQSSRLFGHTVQKICNVERERSTVSYLLVGLQLSVLVQVVSGLACSVGGPGVGSLVVVGSGSIVTGSGVPGETHIPQSCALVAEETGGIVIIVTGSWLDCMCRLSQ